MNQAFPSFLIRQWYKLKFYTCRALGFKTIKQNFFWGKLYVSFDWIGANIFFGNFENDETKLLTSLVAKNATILDVGANIGYYSIMLAKHASVGMVYSFEPSSREHDLLLKNISINALQNIKPFKQALGAKVGTEKLFIDELNYGANSLLETSHTRQFEQVNVSTIDEIIQREGATTVNLIKIDVEGWEYEVLKGAQKVIEQFRPLIFFESWKSYKQKYSTEMTPELYFLSGLSYYFTSFYNNRLHKINLDDEILTKDLLAIPNENKIPV